MKRYVVGEEVYHFGSNGSKLHEELKKQIPNIKSVDLFGNPDVKQDFNESLIFKDNSIDTIIASELIEHLHSPYEFLKECNRVLKPEGRLIITTPNALSLEEMKTLFMEKVFGRNTRSLKHAGHIHTWNKSNLLNLCEWADMNVLEARYTDFHWTRNLLFIGLSKILPFFKPKLFFVIEK